MKKLLLSLVLIIASITSYCQKDESVLYKAYQTEFYTFNTTTDKWVLETKHDDVNINIVFFKNSINVQALTPTLFKLKKETKESFNMDNIYGVKFDAFECVKETVCRVNYIYTKEGDIFILSIVFQDETLGNINLRYYCKMNN
jgi:hypothetical protein